MHSMSLAHISDTSLKVDDLEDLDEDTLLAFLVTPRWPSGASTCLSVKGRAKPS